MPRINIKERDLTTTTVDSALENVVYIPGFSIELKAPIRTPILCPTIYEFEKTFGKTIPAFSTDQAYLTPGADVAGFAAAITGSANQFAEGDADPSYLMARNLLNAGIPVVYERVNTETVNTEISEADSENPGFQIDADNPTTAPTSSTAPVYEGTEGDVIYVTYEASSQDDSYDYNYWVYDAESEAKWIPVTKNIYVVSDADENTGAPVKLTKVAINISEMYDYLLNDRFTVSVDNELLDKSKFNLQFVTTGGYPVFECDTTSTKNVILQKMIAFTKVRTKDSDNELPLDSCQVLYDHIDNRDRDLVGKDSVFASVNKDHKVDCTWATMCCPGWVSYGDGSVLPGSYAYLISLARSVQTNPSWLAIAGVSRGVIPEAVELTTNRVMTRAIADSYMRYAEDTENNIIYSTFINPILNIRPYGLTIWGNRTSASTAKDTDKATYHFNLRVLTSIVKKICYRASERYMFEQNSDVLWINFKAMIAPTLDNMVTSYGISGYKIIKGQSDKKSQLKATIVLYPIEPVDYFDITIDLRNEDNNSANVYEE